MSIQECRVAACRSRNPDGTCREASININSLKMCNKVNTKKPLEKASAKTDYSKLSVERELNP